MIFEPNGRVSMCVTVSIGGLKPRVLFEGKVSLSRLIS